ncbi:MAG: protease modulator HflC [Burkholderiaceae bacterium]
MNRLLTSIVVLVLAGMLLRSCVFVVDQRQFAVKYALGEIREVIDEAGLYFKLPVPFQNVEYHDKRILTIDNPDIDRFVTAEKLNILLDSYVKWRIVDPRAYIRSVQGSQRIAVDRILRSLRDGLQNEVARLTVADVISLQRDRLMERVRAKVNDDSSTIGVEIIDVRLKRVDFEPNVQEGVFTRMQSERKRVANERRATGAAESERIRADAERQREIIIAEAYREAQGIKGDGDAQAAAIYAEAFQRDADFAAFYRSLGAYQSSFRNRSDVLVVDPSAEFFRFFKESSGQSAGAAIPSAPR